MTYDLLINSTDTNTNVIQTQSNNCVTSVTQTMKYSNSSSYYCTTTRHKKRQGITQFNFLHYVQWIGNRDFICLSEVLPVQKCKF